MKAPKTNDFDLRLLVTKALLDTGVSREAIRHEITLDTSSSDGRADIVVAQDHEICGIEIKSGRDTLDRLETQRDQYRRRFDLMVLVCDARHCEADEHGQTWNWRRKVKFGSVEIVSRSADCSLVLGGGRWSDHLPWNRSQWRGTPLASQHQAPAAMLSMLWRSEVYDIAARLVCANKIPAARTDTRVGLIPHLACYGSISLLRPLIAQALRRRELNRWEAAFWRRFDAAGKDEAAA